MPNKLVKMAAAENRRRKYTLLSALQNGGPVTWLSCLVMGFGNFMSGQIVKGLIFLAIEVGFGWFMFLPKGGLYWLSLLFPLSQKERVPNVINHPILGEVIDGYIETGEYSQVALLYGVATVAICVLFIFFWRMSVCSGYYACSRKKDGKPVNTIIDDIKDLFDSKIHNLLMTLPTVGLLAFTVLPLVYMICMAFTDYDRNHLDNNFSWIGFENFINILSFNSTIGKQFWSVLGWTLTWAVFATFLNFFLGTFVAIIINRPTTRLKGLWRGCLCVTIAIPQFVSLLIMRSMLQDDGIINRMLLGAGWISKYIPFLSERNWARATVIIINLWVGIPYTIMQVTGILKNIPADQYEAARIDGANVVQQFTNITLPYMIFVMTPYMITSFTGNINNFNVIFLLSGGNPVQVGNSAGDTDLLVTWLYKLSVNLKDYNMAAVIGILTFIVLATVSLLTYRSSGSYKDEEGFR
ncbi:MAG: sugar ABC transporter permease [Firmicutes bacterium]|nr:sugar ABC transporter permease [Bacillota bacterium]